MNNRLIAAAVLAAGIIASTGGTAAREKLTLHVTPNVSNAPSNITVKATVAPDAANRWLRVEADSGAFYRSSAIQLDGDKAPEVTEFKLSNLPGGEYAVSAVLRNSHGEEITVRRTLIVLSRFGEP